MALGSNRDYVKTHKATMTAIKKAGWGRLWKCPACERENLMKFRSCPRCGATKPRLQ